MDRTSRMALFFIILVAIYYCWNSYVQPVRSDEAYLYLKSMGLSWTTLAPSGLIEYIIKGMNYVDSTPVQLRLPSVVLVSLSAFIVYYTALKLANIHAAWFSMILFLVSPAVTYSYASMTPNALFIFCFAVYVYAFYMITSSYEKSLKYYIWLLLSMVCAVSVDFLGILLLINGIIYIFIKKDIMSDKKYISVSAISVLALIMLAAAHIFGIFDLFYKYPVMYDNDFIYKLLLFIVIYLPVFAVLFAVLKNKKTDEKIKPIFVSAVVFAVGGVCCSIINNYDVRYLGALIIPAVIIAGYFYEVYGYKIMLGAVMVILVLTSVYTGINNKSPLTPGYMQNVGIYESVKMSMLDIMAGHNECIFSHDKGLSSILSYNTYNYPEACTVTECMNTSGLFVSKEKEDNLDKYFTKVKDANIYRYMSMKDGEFKLYFYEVEGLKKNQ